VSLLDLACMPPFNTSAAAAAFPAACTAAATFKFTDQAALNPIVIQSGALADLATAANRPNPGFLLYIAGRISLIELAGPTLPTNTVWTLRSYSGFVNGGNGAFGPQGPYEYFPTVRPATAIGTEYQITYTVSNNTRSASNDDLTRVHTVPDPYYVTSGFEVSATDKVIKFVNLPTRAIIRIYSSSGVLVRVLEHNSESRGLTDEATSVLGGEETWDVRNRNNQVVASGVYFYHIESGDARRVGRFTVVNFAQ
jgi:hypothetical protein